MRSSVECLKHLVVTKEVCRDVGVAEGKGEGGGEDGETSSVKRRFDLDKIVLWTNDCRYTRLQQLQDDLLAVLKLGRSEYESKTCQESVKLERAYLRVRDDVCKGGSLLWSPALEYTTKYVRQ